MKTLVQKFGGTSVATEESRLAVIDKISKAKSEGNRLVVVVSAMGRSGDPYATDTILDLIREKHEDYNMRELDMAFVCGEMISAAVIASHLNQIGLKAIALNGQQAGILADDNHFSADILSIDAERINRHLEEGYVVIVTGGQAVNSKGDFTTLGRGGSDTSAVALGNVIGAYETIIYTDVVGIMSADPRVVKDALVIKEISFENCLKLADEGAKVIHPRAVKEAQNSPSNHLYVRSTFSDDEGTFIGEIAKENTPHMISITKLALSSETSKITLVGDLMNLLEENLLKVIDENQFKVSNIDIAEHYISFNVDKELENKVLKIMHKALI